MLRRTRYSLLFILFWEARRQRLPLPPSLRRILGPSAQVTTLSLPPSLPFSLPPSLTPSLQVTQEHIEILVQFGYVSMFAVAFPLAPVLALLNNLWEARLDLMKLKVQRGVEGEGGGEEAKRA